MVNQSFLDIGEDVARFISRQKKMELRRKAFREILQQCTDPAGTFENAVTIAENWKGMVKLPEYPVLGEAFLDAHRTSPEMAKKLKESAEAELDIDQRRYISDDASMAETLEGNLAMNFWSNRQDFLDITRRAHPRGDAETQIQLWVSNDIERFRANLQRDIAQSGTGSDRETILGFFEEWAAWNDNFFGQRDKLGKAKLHDDCFLILSTIQFAIKDREHRLRMIKQAQIHRWYNGLAVVNQVYHDVIQAYRAYDNPEHYNAGNIVYAEQIAKHLTLP
ncbi:uncharacterized protein EAE97_004753 [Botrytis byssoidea]|uniref:Uncharacterized protein n=1 Tax=Botrytis byssoidea TaxID=139641 RepID=A0A9P5IL56_9HELO|nr:uncharacterized protein EAE97_004753 [Botrytis byssoidea]KAF7945715.1 hypothetical protein EAE97_004753 [Botrytis byssoidea]